MKICVLTKILNNLFYNCFQEHKTSYAKMALASKDKMPKIAAEIKEKEEQEKEKQRRLKSNRPQARLQG